MMVSYDNKINKERLLSAAKIFAEEFERLHPMMKVPAPKKAWSNPPYTIVEFTDGKKVVVKCEEGKEYSFYAGYCIAIVKRLMGSASAIEDSFKNAVWEATEKRKFNRELLKQRLSEQRKLERIVCKRRHELDVQKEYERLKIEREARAKLQADILREEANGNG